MLVDAMHRSIGAKPLGMDDNVSVFGQMRLTRRREVCLQCLRKTRCPQCIGGGGDVFNTQRVDAKTHRDVS